MCPGFHSGRTSTLAWFLLRQRSFCHQGHFLAPDGRCYPHLECTLVCRSSAHVVWMHVSVAPGPPAFLLTPAETGGICISPRPSEEGAEILPCMAMRPLFGIVPVLMDEKVNHPVHAPCPAPLLVLPPWPPLPSPPHEAPTAGSPLRGESPSGVPVLFLPWARHFGEQEMVTSSVSLSPGSAGKHPGGRRCVWGSVPVPGLAGHGPDHLWRPPAIPGRLLRGLPW